MYGIDKNVNAVKASRVNSQLWELGEKYRAECIDIDEVGTDKKTMEKIGSIKFICLYITSFINIYTVILYYFLMKRNLINIKK